MKRHLVIAILTLLVAGLIGIAVTALFGYDSYTSASTGLVHRGSVDWDFAAIWISLIAVILALIAFCASWLYDYYEEQKRV